MMKIALILVAAAGACRAAPPVPATGPAATKSAGDAADLYLRAAALIKWDSPSESNLSFAIYPPYSVAWHHMADHACAANQPVFELVHAARAIDHAAWPAELHYLNLLRRIGNQIGDACLHEYDAGRHAAAIEFVRDELHMARLLDERPPRQVVRILVANGFYAQACNRLMVVSAGINFRADEKDSSSPAVETAREIIDVLLDQRDPRAQIEQVFAAEKADGPTEQVDADRLRESMNRVNAERTYAAMSLACHLGYFKTGHWPQSLKELTPEYLPRLPIDPWGDGKQTFGYVLIKNGLPDGSHRPLVYSRCGSAGELYFRTDEPQYGYDQTSAINPATGFKHGGGQFRDVARWEPPNPNAAPASKRLPPTGVP